MVSESDYGAPWMILHWEPFFLLRKFRTFHLNRTKLASSLKISCCLTTTLRFDWRHIHRPEQIRKLHRYRYTTFWPKRRVSKRNWTKKTISDQFLSDNQTPKIVLYIAGSILILLVLGLLFAALIHLKARSRRLSLRDPWEVSHV